MASPTLVTFVGSNDKQHPALLIGPADAAVATLFVGREDGSVTVEYDIPRRAPSDYDEKGGGRTFH